MTYKLLVNPSNPPTDALIVTEVINAQSKGKVEVVWCKDWKGTGNVKLLDDREKLLGERSNDVSRYFARTLNTDLYGGVNPQEKTEVDHWLSFAIGPLGSSSLKESTLTYLDGVLMTNTWLVSKKLTAADVHVFSALFNRQYLGQFEKKFINITRWYKQILSLPAVIEVLSSIKKNKSPTNDVQTKKTNSKQVAARKEEGKFIDLPGAEMGKVVVRFPPEASGYLHIGHAKAALLNQYYAEAFEGQLIMRFDDTNPAKENVEFEQAILEDLKMLQIKPDRFTHTSDYFDLMLQYCTKLIQQGKAFVDDTPASIMKEQRDQKLMSENRENSIEKNLALWKEMQEGTPRGQECCVRAKIDYQSANGCLRDPTIYRCKPEPHPRTGTKYKVYPTYDFACPIVDAIENVTHTLRTTEYHDRDPQFYWIIEALGLRCPYIWEYSRLNMTNTVLSKRKLTWFVNEGLVDGWDDPRFPTVRGILRRGMTVEGLKQFIIAQGSSKSVVFMEWDKIWSFNRKIIDPIAIRYTGLDYNNVVTVHVTDAKEQWMTVQNHPKDQSIGTKKVLISPTVLIDKEDAEMLVAGQNATFINWGNILIQKLEKENGVVKKVVAQTNTDNKDYKNTSKITWLALPSEKSQQEAITTDLIPCYAVYFDHIMSKAVLGKDDSFEDFVAKDTRTEVQLLGEVELKRVRKGEIIQLQRKGFFRCDVPYAAASPFSSREQPLILFHIPDGHTAPLKNLATNATPQTVNTKTKTDGADTINDKIVAQGDKVRRLKTEKVDKATIDAEVKVLLNLKAEYKACTGSDWKPGAAPKKVASTGDKSALLKEITKQEQTIEDLQKQINKELQRLASLKAEYKSDSSAAPAADPSQQRVDELHNAIVEQGNKIRELKSLKAAKDIVEKEVKSLLALKTDYKSIKGEEWKPPTSPTSKPATSKRPEASQKTNDVRKPVENPKQAGSSANDLSNQIQEQGDKVRQLKGSKAEKSVIDAAVKVLLNLKAEYKSASGQDWKPPSSATNNANATATNADALSRGIQNQGDKVRDLKASKAEKAIVDQEVKVLLTLKNNYKNITGQEWKTAKPDATPKKRAKVDAAKQSKPSEKQVAKTESAKDADASKTGTRLGLEARKEENFFDWYSQIITKSGMIEYYDVSGCYILRPWSFAIWKVIKEYIDKEITKMGVQECYFPIFVTRAVLEKEKSHIADFAPEVAWVTKCGDSDLAEPIAIRPTSETVMYPAYAKWLRSDSELPLRLNQWNNVVRWEFKDPKPFLRTREFLWQEGHTAFATKAEADEEVLIILDMYARVYEDLLAIPVVKGRKTEKEKFAGGDYTTTVEAFISTSGRAIQGATSHHLGQNFSKMFSIQVEGATDSDEKTFVYQNSWGLTTRTIGVMIMVHGDDKGLVLPPNVAAVQAVIVPCGITASTTPKQRERLSSECNKLYDELSKDGAIRVRPDYRSNRTPGWKFNHWELKGVPVRVELGPKDMEKNQVTFVRRDNSERVVAGRSEALKALHGLLTEIQATMLAKARKNLNEHIKQIQNWNDFCSELNKKNLLLSPFCGGTSCEENIKADSAREDSGDEPGALSMGAKSLCIPFEQPKPSTQLDRQTCIHPNCRDKPKFYTLFGRSY